MPNPIKYNTSTESNALKSGDFWIGTGDVSKGPTSITGYWNGITPPAGGYTVYLNKASNGPSISVCSNDADLIALTNRISGNNYTTVAQCLVYYQTQDDKVCMNRDYEGIVTAGLVLNLDAGYTPSYPTTGTTWYDLSGNDIDGTLVNGPTFDSGNVGNIVFDGTDESINIAQTPKLDLLSYTYAFWIKRRQTQSSTWLQFLQRSTSNRNPGIWFYINEVNRIHFSIRLSNNLNTSVNPGGFFLNEWHYFTATVDYNGTNTIMRGYTDGIQQNVLTLSNVAPILGTGGTYVGRRLLDIGNLQIYNRALTPEEVLQNYNATKGRYGL